VVRHAIELAQWAANLLAEIPQMTSGFGGNLHCLSFSGKLDPGLVLLWKRLEHARENTVSDYHMA
jgi:hypothetical protein